MSRHRLFQPEIFKYSKFWIRAPRKDKQAFKNYERIHFSQTNNCIIIMNIKNYGYGEETIVGYEQEIKF